MCEYVIVITVIVRQDVDGHFGTTVRLPTSMFSANMSASLQSDNNRSISDHSPPDDGFSILCRFTAVVKIL